MRVSFRALRLLIDDLAQLVDWVLKVGKLLLDLVKSCLVRRVHVVLILLVLVLVLLLFGTLPDTHEEVAPVALVLLVPLVLVGATVPARPTRRGSGRGLDERRLERFELHRLQRELGASPPGDGRGCLGRWFGAGGSVRGAGSAGGNGTGGGGCVFLVLLLVVVILLATVHIVVVVLVILVTTTLLDGSTWRARHDVLRRPTTLSFAGRRISALIVVLVLIVVVLVFIPVVVLLFVLLTFLITRVPVIVFAAVRG